MDKGFRAVAPRALARDTGEFSDYSVSCSRHACRLGSAPPQALSTPSEVPRVGAW